LSTLASGKSGINNATLQFGRVMYLERIVFHSPDTLDFEKVEIFGSEDFVQWKKIVEKKNLRGSPIEIPLTDANASFMRVVIVSKGDFKLSQIECFAPELPKNEIYNLRVRNIGENTATIEWRTKLKSISYLEYATKVKGEKRQLVQTAYKTEHSTELSGLKKGTDYIVGVVSEAPDGSRVKSEVLEFRTRGIPYPDIWALEAKEISPFTASIFYRANVPVRHQVLLGRSEDALEKVIEEASLKEENTFEIKGLQPETEYYYRLDLTDRFGNVVMTPPIRFRTPPYNIALGKRVWGTFGFTPARGGVLEAGEENLAKLVDGNVNYFGGTAVSQNADNADQYAVIDLGEISPVDRLEIIWWGLSYSRNYRIDLSNDGENWTTVSQRLNADRGEAMRSPAGDLIVRHTVPVGKSARFVRLFVRAKAPRGTRSELWEPMSQLYLSEIAVIRDMK